VVGLLSSMDSNGYGYSNTIQRWDIDTQKTLWFKYTDPSLSLRASDYNRWGLYKSEDKITFFDLKTGVDLQTLSLQPLQDRVNSFSFSPDEKFLAIGTWRGVILLFSLEGALAPE
jgi:WD40 repeat protein